MRRRIALKTLDSVDQSGNPQKLGYANYIIGLVKAQPGGVTRDEMDLPLGIVRAVEAAVLRGADAVVLEEAAHAYLAARVRGTRWSWLTEELRQFCDDVTEAEVVGNSGDGDPVRSVPRVGPVISHMS